MLTRDDVRLVEKLYVIYDDEPMFTKGELFEKMIDIIKAHDTAMRDALAAKDKEIERLKREYKQLQDKCREDYDSIMKDGLP